MTDNIAITAIIQQLDIRIEYLQQELTNTKVNVPLISYYSSQLIKAYDMRRHLVNSMDVECQIVSGY